MSTARQSVNELLVPGMLDQNIGEAMAKASSLVGEMREYAPLCRRVLNRLDNLLNQLDPLNLPSSTAHVADTIRLLMVFLKKYTARENVIERLAPNRRIVDGIRQLHLKLDKLEGASEMTTWEGTWEQDLLDQLESTRHLLMNTQVAIEYANTSPEEVVTELQYELKAKLNGPTVEEHMTQAITLLAQHCDVGRCAIPEYYIPRYDVEKQTEFAPFDVGTFGELYHAKWTNKPDEVVVIKWLYTDDERTKEAFAEQNRKWFPINHPNVIKMYGSCHVGRPLFFVSEFASNGNFTDFFKKSKENKSKLWGLFHEVAQGLLYLHEHGIVHGDIKCVNLLVDANESAKISDFGYTRIKNLSVGKSVKQHPTSLHWKAPECILDSDKKFSPEADVFALGMSIIEAKTGALPYQDKQEEDIIHLIMELMDTGAEFPRPDGAFTDGEWEVVHSMCAFDVDHRSSLADAIAHLDSLNQCPTCSNGSATTRFCGDCGAQVGQKRAKMA
ncbi:Serine/threonine protein kinase, partial [Globisporangium splendens]